MGTVQGTDASAMSNETLVSNLGDGWAIRNNQVVPKMINSVDNIVNPVFSNVLISDATANVSTNYADFIGSYAPITTGLIDSHNPNGDAMHPAISINEPAHEGYTFSWYTDAVLTTPVTTIPFSANGTVTLYAKNSINRKITGHNGNDDDGWVFIASPVSGSITPTAVGIVQVIDLLGRVLVNRDANERITTDGLVGGVYVLSIKIDQRKECEDPKNRGEISQKK